MKTKLFLLSILFSSITLWGQQADKSKSASEKDKCEICGKADLIYDFKCKRFYYKSGTDSTLLKDLSDLKIKYKHGFRFKIINLNKYLYQTTVSFDDVILQSDEPESFKKLFLGDGFNFDFSKVASTKGATDGESLTQAKLDDFTKKLSDFKKKYNTILEDYSKAYSICPQEVLCCGKKTDEDSINYAKLSESLFELKLSFEELEPQIASVTEKAQSNLTDLKAKLKVLTDNLAKAETPAQKAALKLQIKIAEESIKANEDQLTVSKTNKLKTDKLKAQLDAFDDNKLMDLIHFYKNFVSENFEYISPTIYPTGDKLELNIKISPNTSDEAKKWQTMPLYDDEFNLDLSVRNKWFYSFSTGPFVGLSDGFRTQNYGWQKQPNVDGEIADDSKYKLVKAGKEGMPIGIGAYANFGTKFTDYYGLGVSIGAGATILNDAKLAYFAGITNFFGQEKQFNLTAGVTFMQVNELKKELYTDIGTQLYDAPITNLEYTKKFISGFFVSLTYSVFTSSNVKKGSSSNGSKKEAADTKSPDSKPAEDSKTDDTKPKEETKTETKTQDSVLEGAKKVKIKY